MKAIYESLKSRLLNKTTITDIRPFNNQLNDLEKQNLFLPTILIEFQEIEFFGNWNDHQSGHCTMRVHIIAEDYQDEPTRIFDLKDQVNKALIWYTDRLNFKPLERKFERPDTNYTNLFNYQIDYELEFIDHLILDSDETEITLNLDLKTDLDNE